MTNQTKGFRRIINAFNYSMKGFRATWIHEAAFRQEILLFIILGPLGLWLGENGIERALLLASLVLVLIIELVNSAIEAVVDRAGSEWNELSGRAKDIGSSAVFLGFVNMVLVWGLILTPHM